MRRLISRVLTLYNCWVKCHRFWATLCYIRSSWPTRIFQFEAPCFAPPRNHTIVLDHDLPTGYRYVSFDRGVYCGARRGIGTRAWMGYFISSHLVLCRVSQAHTCLDISQSFSEEAASYHEPEYEPPGSDVKSQATRRFDHGFAFGGSTAGCHAVDCRPDISRFRLASVPILRPRCSTVSPGKVVSVIRVGVHTQTGMLGVDSRFRSSHRRRLRSVP